MLCYVIYLLLIFGTDVADTPGILFGKDEWLNNGDFLLFGDFGEIWQL